YYYGNEKEVGEGIRQSNVPRSEIFVTTKLWGDSHHPHQVRPAFERSLKDLGLDYLDLYLMHWPVAIESGGTVDNGTIDYSVGFLETWAAMEKLLDTGKVKAIGVSNFSIRNLKKLLSVANVCPAVNQIEAHPYLTNSKLIAFAKEKGIHTTAYCPLGSVRSGELRAHPKIVQVAQKHDTQPATILISWAVQRGTSTIPKSASLARIESNFKIVELTPGDMAVLDSISTEKTLRTCGPYWGADVFSEA
ncbi:hypothetical protein DFQ26_009630, partial [Actinomortierella ambigua]